MSIAEAAFSFTTKVNGDLLTARADNIFDMKKRLEDLAELIGDAQAVSVLAGGAASAASLTAPAVAAEPFATPPPPAAAVVPTPPPAPAPAPAAPAPAAGPTPTCIHGPRVYRSSKPDAAKQWAAWMCPTPKGTAGQCEPQWVRD